MVRSEAILIIGAPGAGKSATAEALSDLLADDGVEHGALEAEQLAWGHPWLTWDATLPLLTSLLRHQAALGRRRFVIVATPETDAQLEALVGALPVDRVRVVALRASPITLARRVLAREPLHWSGRDHLARRARDLAETIPALRRVDAVVETETAAPLDVARVILGRREGASG